KAPHLIGRGRRKPAGGWNWSLPHRRHVLRQFRQAVVGEGEGDLFAFAVSSPHRPACWAKLPSLDNSLHVIDSDGMALVKVTPDALKQLGDLPRVIRERMGTLFKRLEAWPAVSGAKPLSGELAGWYRLRTGDYRVRFRVQEELILVDKLGHRSKFYDD